ncbi:unnamed protein product [Mytilus edulis]|uniref:Uncharacterized protein n=1 Tax=Mytilus edulis TaxID=6550 RepID=A0A8S3V5Z5_MYTED|nr:unnamed protein product [Mytilus edulis]
MHKYPSMQINNFKLYCQKTARIQEYVTNAKHYENRNQGGERETFINHFNLIQWLKISETERKQHKLENCMPCNTTHIEISKIHKSVSETSIQILNLSEQIVENVSSILPTSTATKAVHTSKLMGNINGTKCNLTIPKSETPKRKKINESNGKTEDTTTEDTITKEEEKKSNNRMY